MSERCRSTIEPVLLRSFVEQLRRQFGVSVTTNHEENTTMATANPYDRRDKRPDHFFGAADFARQAMVAAPQGLSFTPPRAIAMEDIDAMAASAFTRGELAATERLARRDAEATRRAQQTAWDEGHEQGEEDSRRALLRSIAEQHEKRVRAIHEKGATVLERIGGDPDSVEKRELELALDNAIDLLAELAAAHHAGFEPRPC